MSGMLRVSTFGRRPKARRIHRAPIVYEKAYNVKEMETVKLRQDFVGGATRVEKCIVFSGAEGTEGLLQMKERFDTICEVMQWDDGDELFTNFPKVLSENAEESWRNLTDGIAIADRTPIRFEAEYANLLEKYATNRGCDFMKDYLYSEEVKKKHDTECQEHCDRMETLHQ